METTKMILDWLGQQSTLIVAVAGFISAIIVAKITGGIELKKALCLKRVDAFEAARCQLMRMTNTYEVILGSMSAITQDLDSSTIGDKIVILLSPFIELEKVLRQDENLARIALYVTELPRQDVRQLLAEEPRFVNVIRKISEKLQRASSKDERDVLEVQLKQEINRIAPLIQMELQHLYDLDDKLKNDMRKDKKLRQLFAKSEDIMTEQRKHC